MATHMDVVREAVAAEAIEASALATNMAVALSGDEIITGKAGIWRRRLHRYPLCDLALVREFPDARMTTLTLKFENPSRSLMLTYGPGTAVDFERIIQKLRQRLKVGLPGGHANA